MRRTMDDHHWHSLPYLHRFREGVSPQTRRACLVNEITNLEDLCASVDLSAFPMPMKVKVHGHNTWCCRGGFVMVMMSIVPRDPAEVRGVNLTVNGGTNGLLNLHNTTDVDEAYLKVHGAAKALEQIRKSAYNMVLHELHECFMFRGSRIYDPHQQELRPEDVEF